MRRQYKYSPVCFLFFVRNTMTTLADCVGQVLSCLTEEDYALVSGMLRRTCASIKQRVDEAPRVLRLNLDVLRNAAAVTAPFINARMSSVVVTYASRQVYQDDLENIRKSMIRFWPSEKLRLQYLRFDLHHNTAGEILKLFSELLTEYDSIVADLTIIVSIHGRYHRLYNSILKMNKHSTRISVSLGGLGCLKNCRLCAQRKEQCDTMMRLVPQPQRDADASTH